MTFYGNSTVSRHNIDSIFLLSVARVSHEKGANKREATCSVTCNKKLFTFVEAIVPCPIKCGKELNAVMSSSAANLRPTWRYYLKQLDSLFLWSLSDAAKLFANANYCQLTPSKRAEKQRKNSRRFESAACSFVLTSSSRRIMRDVFFSQQSTGDVTSNMILVANARVINNKKLQSSAASERERAMENKARAEHFCAGREIHQQNVIVSAFTACAVCTGREKQTNAPNGCCAALN